MTDKHRTALRVKVGLVQRERLADPRAGTPQHDDDAAQPHALRVIAGCAHDRHDLLDSWRVWRIPHAFVAGR
jgi:hypothetical protein